MKKSEILMIAICYISIIFSMWVIYLNIKYKHDTEYLITKASNFQIELINMTQERDSMEEMVQSLNTELDVKEAYIYELESKNKLLKDLQSSKK